MIRFVRSVALATAALLVASSCNVDQPVSPKVGVRTFSGGASSVITNLVLYDFTVDANATTVAPGLTASAFTRGPGLTVTTAAGAFNSSAWTTVTTGPDAGDYVEFTVTPAAGTQFTATELSFSEQRSGTGPVTWLARLVPPGGAEVDLASGTTVTSLGPHTVPIPVGLQGPYTAAVKIRLYAYGATASGGTWRQDNVLLRGDIGSGGGGSGPVDHITVSPASATVLVGGTQQFTAAAFDAANNPVTLPSFLWSSTNPATASVDANGRATGVAAGDVSIEARSPNGTVGFASLHVDPVSLPNYSGQLVLSQIYGGGGNAGAQYKNDFIEIFNRGTTAVTMTNWSVQYSSANGTNWSATPISGTIPPGGYFLVQEAAGTGGTLDLPTPNAVGTIAVGATNGNILLAQQSAAFTTLCPSGNVVVDIVSFGSSTNCANPAPAMSNTTADARKNGGCRWTSNATNDFLSGAPAPRNSASPTRSCVPGPLDHVAITGATTVLAGGTTQLAAEALDANDNTLDGASFTWSTDNAGIATVSGTGLVTGVAGNGTPAVISASATLVGITKSASTNITVNNPGGINWLDIVVRSSSFPIGFQTEVFATARESQNGTIIPATFTFETVDSAYMIVTQKDQEAIVTATGVRPDGLRPDIKITATPTAGGPSYTFIAHPITVETPVSSPASTYGVNDDFGRPSAASIGNPNDFLIVRNQFTLSYNQSRGTPNWVAWELDARQFASGADRCNCFTADPLLPDNKKIFTSDYTSGGYDRGHMSPSADRTTQNVDNASTFYLTNIVPQQGDLNQGVWADLEGDLRDSVRAGRAVYVVTGPIYSGPLTFLKNEGKVAIPDSTWKVALIGPATGGNPFTHNNVQSFDDLPGLTLIAVNMPNVAGIRNDPWSKYLTKVDKIEASTGLDILSVLQTGMQGALDYNDHKPVAAFSVSGSQFEGSALTFDASASTDADFSRTDLGLTEALTYSWTFSDGTTATGKVVSKSFGNDGNYSATLTVRDAWGWPATASSTVAIANVAPSIAFIPGGTRDIGLLFTASSSFTDPGDENWTATVNYGDGTGTMPLTLNGKNFTISHAWAVIGNYTITVSISDGVATSTRTGNILIQAPPVPGADGPYSANEGASISMSGAGSTDADGVIVNYAWDFGDGASATGVNVAHTYAQDGSYTVTLTVRDDNGHIVSTTTTATVANIAPFVSAFSGATILIGTTFSANGTFSDPGSDAFTGTVDFGDGSGAQTISLGAGTYAFSHQYNAPGTYTVTLSVSDDDVATTQTATVVVLSATQALENISASIDGLGLNNGNTNSLKSKLNAAISSIGNGNLTAARNQLNALLNEIDAMRRSNRLTPPQAAALRAAVEAVLATL